MIRKEGLNLQPPLLLGIDVGGTKSAAVIGTLWGKTVDRVEWPSRAGRGPTAMIGEQVRRCRQLLRQYASIAAVGVAIGGPLDARQGIVHSPPNLPGWDGIPLRATLEERLGLPTCVEHDAAACCLAEYHWGAGVGASRLIYLTCGTGFGAGIVIDGEIYRGAGGRNVEVGHARLRQAGPEAFGKQGSVEAFCSARSLGLLATWRYPHRWRVSPPPAEVAALAQDGDADARQVLELTAAALGEFCANLGDLLRPDRILLGSLARFLGPAWVESVRGHFEDEALPETSAACEIRAAGLGERLQDCSALVVARSALGMADGLEASLAGGRHV